MLSTDIDYGYDDLARLKYGKNLDIWTTKNGTKINIKNMTTSHIMNVMRMIGEEDFFYDTCVKELKRRKI